MLPNFANPFRFSLAATLLTTCGCASWRIPSDRFHADHQECVSCHPALVEHDTSVPLAQQGAETALSISEPLSGASGSHPQTGLQQIGRHLRAAGQHINRFGSAVSSRVHGEALAEDPFDPHFNEHVVPASLIESKADPEPEPSKVPWPRFHPVPTRPLLGG